jgi:hypothetical protein
MDDLLAIKEQRSFGIKEKKHQTYNLDHIHIRTTTEDIKYI